MRQETAVEAQCDTHDDLGQKYKASANIHMPVVSKNIEEAKMPPRTVIRRRIFLRSSVMSAKIPTIFTRHVRPQIALFKYFLLFASGNSSIA